MASYSEMDGGDDELMKQALGIHNSDDELDSDEDESQIMATAMDGFAFLRGVRKEAKKCPDVAIGNIYVLQSVFLLLALGVFPSFFDSFLLSERSFIFLYKFPLFNISLSS